MLNFFLELDLLPFNLSFLALIILSMAETIGYYLGMRPSTLIKRFSPTWLRSSKALHRFRDLVGGDAEELVDFLRRTALTGKRGRQAHGSVRRSRRTWRVVRHSTERAAGAAAMEHGEPADASERFAS